ncbi:serpin family protein [Actinophytocola algeriensis]|uniref:Serpin B n=1 Tax=Actinophytocola algeriensis TaxID=1768010 RepID=A0A7W7Q1I9_9PSEU|nr:serpin family protein [Actinophytocola algeriensis]MBB4905123.1 serpin B [Actinophytocola algeriensis]MBE1473192.1 serpin B [Actinophytocola algeriensis]
MTRRLAALGLVLLLTACGAEPEAAGPPPPPVPVARTVPADTAAQVSAIDAFGLDLLTAPTLADRPNLVVSPVSASLALQMIGAGAAGETAAQMAKVLHLPDGARAQLPAFDQTDLKVSNTAWAQQGLELKPGYRDTLRDRFGTSMRTADFRADPGEARREINRTVADQTAGKITDLFPDNAITEDSRLVLTNALYLKAGWAREFPAEGTTDQPFTRADGTTVTVPMMHNDPADEVDLGYAEGPGYQVVTLPYKGGGMAFTVIVPGTVDALRGKGIDAILGEVRPAPVALALPRFTTRSAMDLTETLTAAGMPLAFSDAADFGGITDDAQLRIDSVQHKTFVRIDEKGTEAAAATGVDAHAVSAPVVHTVTVDRPFLFVITDTATGAPLFLGRIADPTA